MNMESDMMDRKLGDEDKALIHPTHCTEEVAQSCVDIYAICVYAVDLKSETFAEELPICVDDLCECFDEFGCDEYSEEAGC